MTVKFLAAACVATACLAESGSLAAAPIPNGLARWLLAGPQPTEPLPALARSAELQFGTAPTARKWSEAYAQQINPAGELYRLPAVEENAESEQGELRFAGGGIVVQLPPDWHVSQADQLRHVRIYLTRQPLSGEEHFREGIWIAYHVRPSTTAENDLPRFMRQRLSDVLPAGSRTFAARRFQLAGHHALQTPFQWPATAEPHAQTHHGYHLLAAADWGVIEIHARYLNDSSAREIAGIVDSLVIGQPDATHGTTTDSPQGTWKAERARLTIYGNGSLELSHDRDRLQQVEQATLTRPARRLRGTYRVDGDVLRVTWTDGSHLNLRYRRASGELLLTDHHGRVSQLQRLFE